MRLTVALGMTIALYAIPAAFWALGYPHYVSYFILAEDGLYESMGALACLAGAVLFAFSSTVSRPTGPSVAQRGWALLFAAALLLMFLEETSWGQRVFRFHTPDYFETQNVVGETNLHNLRTFYVADLETNLLQLVWMLLMLGYFSLMPFFARWSRAADILRNVGIPIPLPSMAAATCANFVLFVATLYVLRNEPSIVAGQHATELFEVNVQILLFAMALRTFHATDYERQPHWKLVVAVTLVGLVGAALLRLSVQTSLPFARSIGAIQQGQRLAVSGELEEALTQFETAAALWPQNALAHHAQGEILEALGNNEQALHAFQAAINLVPTYAAPHIGIAKIYLSEGRLEEAKAHLAEALANDPANADAWNLNGIVLVQRGDRAGGAESFRRALTLAPEHAAAAENLQKVTAATTEH